MNLAVIIDNTKKLAKAHAPELLTGASVVGLATTAYLSAKAGFKASDVIHDDESRWTETDPKGRRVLFAKMTWKLYIPPAVAGFTTAAFIVGSNKVSSKRTAAAVAAYSLTERAFHEYKEKVVEEIGKGKEQKIRDSVAQDKVTSSGDVVIIGSGDVLCCELMTGRYFNSDMEKLRKAQNEINARIINAFYVTLEEFYDTIDLPHTSKSNMLGWDSNKLMELQFSTVLSPDGKPCLAFEYNYVKPV